MQKLSKRQQEVVDGLRDRRQIVIDVHWGYVLSARWLSGGREPEIHMNTIRSLVDRGVLEETGRDNSWETRKYYIKLNSGDRSL